MPRVNLTLEQMKKMNPESLSKRQREILEEGLRKERMDTVNQMMVGSVDPKTMEYVRLNKSNRIWEVSVTASRMIVGVIPVDKDVLLEMFAECEKERVIRL